MTDSPSTPNRRGSVQDDSQIPSPSQNLTGSPKYKPRKSIGLASEDADPSINENSVTPDVSRTSSKPLSHMAFFYKENLKELSDLQERLSNRKSKLERGREELESIKHKLNTVEFKMGNLKEEKETKMRQIALKENEMNNIEKDFELKKEFMESGFELELKKLDGKFQNELGQLESNYKFEYKKLEFENIQKYSIEKDALIKQIKDLEYEILNNDNHLKNSKKEIEMNYSKAKEEWLKTFQIQWIDSSGRNEQLMDKKLELKNKIDGRLKGELEDQKENKRKLEAKLESLEKLYDEKNSYKKSLGVQIDTVKEDTNNVIKQRHELNQYIKTSKEDLQQINEILIKEETMRRKLHNEIQELRGNIRVYCRIRPPLASEDKKTSHLVVSNFNNYKGSQSIVVERDGRKSTFLFDRVFDPVTSNVSVFEEVGQLIQSSLDGYNVCIFAYGQTGSGKTFTMLNDGDGVIPLTLDHIFDWTSSLQERGWHYSFDAQFIEIYNEQIIDLLRSLNKDSTASDKYEIRHDASSQRTSITNITKIKLKTREMVDILLKTAIKMRSTASTQSNERSSRSHSVFTIHINGRNSFTGETSNGVLNLVDLAGSERIDTSRFTGERLRETQNINRSLSCLGDVIYALNDNETKHIPFRNSKLTYLLQYSLIGDSKTLMFANVSASLDHVKETLNSLRFASKVNSVKLSR